MQVIAMTFDDVICGGWCNMAHYDVINWFFGSPQLQSIVANITFMGIKLSTDDFQ